MTDPLQIVADLKPAQLDQITADAYARRRATDLARALGEERSRPLRGAAAGRRHRRSWPLLTGAGLLSAAAAVTAFALTGALAGPATTPGRPGGGGAGTPPAAPRVANLDARTFLLASATVASRAAAGTGSYWYVSERDFELTFASPKGPARPPVKKGSKKVAKPAVQDQDSGICYAATEEIWTGPATARTIVNEDLQFIFRSPADKARWIAQGKPKLFNPTGGFGDNGTRTSNYTETFYFGYGVHRLSVNQARKLPATEAALNSLLRRWWNSEPDKQGAVGPAHPNFGQYVFTWAGALLGGPASQATKAALYRLLADQPGVQVMAGVTDPLGRTGVAVADGTGIVLLIDPGTGAMLASTTAHVHPGMKIVPTVGGTESIIKASWTPSLGARPAS
jgi:hypothetical protein